MSVSYEARGPLLRGTRALGLVEKLRRSNLVLEKGATPAVAWPSLSLSLLTGVQRWPEVPAAQPTALKAGLSGLGVIGKER